MTDDTGSRFYDEFAPRYHLIFDDWEVSIARQAAAISSILQREIGIRTGVDVLDCTCGIGTQSLGLAKLGYRVTGSDLSAGAVCRARAEAQARELNVPFYVADVRHLDELPIGGFEAVISMDNALPHLRSDADLREAARQMRAKLRPRGTLLASIRDYDQLVRDRTTVHGPVFYSDTDRRRIVFQVWDWADDRRYTFHLYITCETASGWSTFHGAALYRAVLCEEITAVLASSDFANIRWLFPNESGFYQPVVIATAIG
jgi:SAM-dependent methyltransferase